ncbi:MAG: hypothetical protein Q8751_02365 [Candidatus Phytoplasma australasiaticum]|nr:hypothetical protein [Candidatus Phytoplasma australasiaticum]
MSVYFALGFNSASEPLAMPIHVSTPVEDSLVVDRVYRSCVMNFTRCETWVDYLYWIW